MTEGNAKADCTLVLKDTANWTLDKIIKFLKQELGIPTIPVKLALRHH
ncbi:MAG: hypothetical protein QNJ18_06870 [Xenococcaceae cyanobacterium MO_167.B52]|nr:hypothetical protein [Xenococcaceae cyanobacterium MO_167.B52]